MPTKARKATTATTVRRRGPTKGDLKEAAILDTAWELLVRKPLSEFTTDDLAQGAGISRSSFYFYFDSKEAVVRALAGRIIEEMSRAVVPFFEGSKPWTYADLREVTTGYIAWWKEKGHLLRANVILEASDASLHQVFSDLKDGILGSIAARVDAQRDAGTLPPGPPASKDLVRVLFAMLFHMGYEISLWPHTPVEEQRLLDAATMVIYRSLTGGRDPSDDPHTRTVRGPS